MITVQQRSYQMSKLRMLSAAITFATKSHHGAFDKQGMPYICHPMAVMALLDTTDEELMCIAVLHDVLEDCYPDTPEGLELGISDLRMIGQSERIINGVVALTKKRNQSYEDYLNGVSYNLDAILVKLADLTHNTSLKRIKGVTQKDADRNAKYYRAYAFLTEQRKNFKG